MNPDLLPFFQGGPTYGFMPSLYFPSLLTQRQWVVKDWSQVNFLQVFSTMKAGEGYEEEVIVQGPHTIVPEPRWSEDHGWEFPTETKTFLSQAFEPLGEEVHFFFRGYPTFLYQQEWDLVEDVLPRVHQLSITIQGSIPYRRTRLEAILLPTNG